MRRFLLCGILALAPFGLVVGAELSEVHMADGRKIQGELQPEANGKRKILLYFKGKQMGSMVLDVRDITKIVAVEQEETFLGEKLHEPIPGDPRVALTDQIAAAKQEIVQLEAKIMELEDEVDEIDYKRHIHSVKALLSTIGKTKPKPEPSFQEIAAHAVDTADAQSLQRLVRGLWVGGDDEYESANSRNLAALQQAKGYLNEKYARAWKIRYNIDISPVLVPGVDFDRIFLIYGEALQEGISEDLAAKRRAAARKAQRERERAAREEKAKERASKDARNYEKLFE